MISKTPESPTQLTDWVAANLRNALLEGQYKPGEWLRQQHIAEELGVSQVPVREALRALSMEGLLEYVPYRGVRVRIFTVEDVEDLYTHRSFLEGQAAFHAAKQISDQELKGLKSLLEKMTRLTPSGNLEEYRELNRQFHERIIAASQRPYLIRTLQQLWATFPNMLWANFPHTARHSLPERDSSDAQEHLAILQSLEAHDPAAARDAMVAHINTARDHLLLSIRNS